MRTGTMQDPELLVLLRREGGHKMLLLLPRRREPYEAQKLFLLTLRTGTMQDPECLILLCCGWGLCETLNCWSHNAEREDKKRLVLLPEDGNPTRPQNVVLINMRMGTLRGPKTLVVLPWGQRPCKDQKCWSYYTEDGDSASFENFGLMIIGGLMP